MEQLKKYDIYTSYTILKNSLKQTDVKKTTKHSVLSVSNQTL